MIAFDPKVIAKKYVGIPYKHLGRDLTGLDCWGLIVSIYKDYGVELFDLENYEQEWARRGKNFFEDNKYENWQRIISPAPGDVILITYPRDVIGHAGVFLERGKFIHATRSGIVIERIKNWKHKIKGYYRWFKK